MHTVHKTLLGPSQIQDFTAQNKKHTRYYDIWDDWTSRTESIG